MDADIKSKIAKGTLGGVILSIMLYVVSQSFFMPNRDTSIMYEL
ncbi:Tryptophanyl-tRNA synthetase-Tryptophan--tRNA ligase [Moritella viscosa]|nr:hypothetical protein [Moritella viscosa]SGY87587.1 Tryptophanyl-tRNA synthetase-Tryptophan--tRNA ligase [Moritella viscosa]